ncbi:MAG: hypothetical protein IT310_02660 [Anaerolineales bacterium]|nr:hypothetical protein [Anaerolineales bacterium]
MSNSIQPSKLEETLKALTQVPEPDAKFIETLRQRFVMEGRASAQKNQEVAMRKIFSKRLVWVWTALTCVVLAVILSRPTVVNALKHLLGYVPKVGLVDQTTQVRVLTQPLTQTRENYVVTIEQAVLNDEGTTVTYSYSLPPNFVMPNTGLETSEAPYLILPDGTRLNLERAQPIIGEDCLQCYMYYSLKFAPLPDQIFEATLAIPELADVPSKTAPKDWEFQLHFKPADASEIAPVIELEVTPTPTNLVTSAPALSVNHYGITNTLDKYAKLSDGYILYGSTAWTDATIPSGGVKSILISIKDANGQELPFDYADPETSPQANELRMDWAYKITTLDFPASVTLTFGITASVPADGGSFTFDPGASPQPSQTWQINQDVTVNNETIHVLSAEQDSVEPGFFVFKMQSDSNIVGAAITDLIHPPMGGGGGGGNLPEVKQPFHVSYGYPLPLPTPPYTLTFTNVEVIVPGVWELTWSP